MVQKRMPKIGIPRLYRSSGTNDPNTFDAIKRLVDRLYDRVIEDGEQYALTLLHALADGSVSFLEALQAKEQDGETGLRNTTKKLRDDGFTLSLEAADLWLNRADLAANSRANYRNNITTLLAFQQKGETKVTHVPVLLKRYKGLVLEKDTNRRAFNLVRSICMAWLRDTVGITHPVYAEVKAIRRVKQSKVITEENSRYFSPRDVVAIMAKLPKDVADMLWFQCLTGMHSKEMMVDGWWKDGPYGLFINGAKNEYRKRTIPRLIDEPPVITIQSYREYWDWLDRASKPLGWHFSTKTARETFVRWAEIAGIPHYRVQIYAGHEPDQTGHYQYHKTDGQLHGDAEMLRKWIAKELEGFTPIDTEIVKRGVKKGWVQTKPAPFRYDIEKEVQRKSRSPLVLDLNKGAIVKKVKR